MARAPKLIRVVEPLALEQQIARFAEKDRAALRTLAAKGKSYADLLWSFPALALALATGWGAVKDRLETARRVELGSPLPLVARALCVPMWLKKAPPELLHFGLPAQLSERDGDASFARAVGNALPKVCEPGSNWLPIVQEARGACGDDYALWLAGKAEITPVGVAADLLRPLAAHAWFSARPHLDAYAFIDRAWTSRASFRGALLSAHYWLVSLCTECCASTGVFEGPWAATREIKGFEFVPLTSSTALFEEGQAMHNCLGDYIERVAMGWSRIYSIRRDGVRVACLELTARRSLNGKARVSQMAGPNNGRVSLEVREAVEAWLAAYDGTPLLPKLFGQPFSLNAEMWGEYWSPYWEEKGALDAMGPDATFVGVTHLLFRTQSLLR